MPLLREVRVLLCSIVYEDRDKKIGERERERERARVRNKMNAGVCVLLRGRHVDVMASRLSSAGDKFVPPISQLLQRDVLTIRVTFVR